MFRIPDVERKPLIPRETIPPVHLSPPCYTGPDRMPETFTDAVIGQILRQERPWADQAHVPAQHIDKLRQLIKTGLPEHASKRRDPMLVELRLTFAFAVHAHRPEFQDRKEPSIQAWAGLTKQNRRSHGRANGNRDHDHERAHDYQAQRSRDKV